MRLLLLNHELPPLGGGAGNATWFIAKALKDHGVDVDIVTAGFAGLPRSEQIDGVDITRLRVLRRRADCSNVLEMLSFLVVALLDARRRDMSRYAGVVAFFSVPSGIVAWRTHRRAPTVPYLVSLRGGDVPGLTPEVTWLHRLIAPIRRRLLRSSRTVVANAPELAALAETADAVPVAVVPNGVDTAFYSPAPQAPANCGARVLFVGRFQAQKNLFVLLSSFAEASNTEPMHLVMVGDGPQRAALQAHAQALGCADRITWLGWMDKGALRDTYRSCDVFANPSLYEGMPNTVLEAMACGLPVVASNIGGNDQLVHHEQTGLLFELGRPQHLADALVRLARSPELRVRLGANARHYVSERHSWQSVAHAYLNLLGIDVHG